MTQASRHSTLLKIDGMHCASCQRPIEKALREIPGVTDVSVNLANREVSVDSTISSDTLVAAVAGAGFDAVVDPIQSLEENDRANKENFRRLIYKTVLALGSGALLMIFGMNAPASSLVIDRPDNRRCHVLHGPALLQRCFKVFENTFSDNGYADSTGHRYRLVIFHHHSTVSGART